LFQDANLEDFICNINGITSGIIKSASVTKGAGSMGGSDAVVSIT
jgi:hypothetical protein